MKHYIPRAYVPGTTVLLLTDTSKMPTPSWGLPAKEACPYALGGHGSICGVCYADKGSYTQYPGVKRAQRARFAWVRECLKTEAGTDEFVRVMVDAIGRTRDRATGGPAEYFRVHDSGDLFSPAYTWDMPEMAISYKAH